MTILERLKQHIASTPGMTQKKISSAVGRSISVISYYLNGKYPGDIDELEKRLEEYLGTAQERAAQPEQNAGVARTSVLVDIMGALNNVSVAQDIGVIAGDSGVGKTTAVRQYAATHPSALVIEAHHRYTARPLFVTICNRLSLDTTGSIHALMTRVVEKLADSGRMIIIDEAEHLPYDCIELVRRVNDMAHVGVALVGMPRLLKNIQGDSGHYAQIRNRVGVFRAIDGRMSDDDLDLLIAHNLGAIGEEAKVSLRKTCKRNARTLDKLAYWCRKLISLNPGYVLDEFLIGEASRYTLETAT